uniref:H/ACA ribonucleoprotein complex subunit 2 n=1 Tax=Dicentrarchus labrax TaxID=13489 RepID=A0A8P4KGH6_DICLA
MTKTKKEKVSADVEEATEGGATEGGAERSYQDLVSNVNPISQPLASKRLSKKLYKCVKKAAKVKNIRRGVKEVQKFINKGEKGIVVLAGDTLPIDVYCHLPVMCEDRSLPYAYIPSKVVSVRRGQRAAAVRAQCQRSSETQVNIKAFPALVSGSGFVCRLQEADLRDPDQTPPGLPGGVRRVRPGGLGSAQTAVRAPPTDRRAALRIKNSLKDVCASSQQASSFHPLPVFVLS